MDETEVISAIEEFFGRGVIQKLDFSKLKRGKDLVSCVYEELLHKQDRKKYAQFFTHKELVDFIITHIPINNQSSILDPACGAGAFMIGAYNEDNLDNLYGIDIDDVALGLCRLNLKLISQKVPINLKKTNTIKDSCLMDLFPKIAKKGGFDIIIGNPPFQNLKKNIDFDENESVYSNVLSGIANSSTLMVAKGFEFLKEGGFLGFVLPKNIARVDSFKGLRQFLINNTKLMYIYDLDHYFKDVRGDQVIIIFQKKKLNDDEIKRHNVKILIHKKNGDFLNPYSYEISQSVFLEYDFFPIFYNKKMFSLADKLLKLKPTLDDVCNGSIFRGLSLGAEHELISKSLSNDKIPIYRGDSIRRFGIKYPLYLDIAKLNGFQENKIKRLKTNKIVLQNLCSKEGGIFAALSSSDKLSLDTVTNITSININQKYLLGILNSKISNFFILHIIFLNSNFTMHTDKKYIGRIPIVFPTPQQEIKVIDIVDKLLKMSNIHSQKFFDEYDKLNETLFDIYGLNQHQKDLINEILSETMSKRQYGRTNE